MVVRLLVGALCVSVVSLGSDLAVLALSEQAPVDASTIKAVLKQGTRDLKARDVDSALRQFKAALAEADRFGDPVWQCRCLDKVAAALSTGKDYAEAQVLLQKSLALRQAHLSGNDLELAASCEQLGIVTMHQLKFVEAIGWFRRALAILAQHYPDDSRYLLHSRRGLAYCLARRGQLREAASTYQKVVDVESILFGSEDQQLIIDASVLANCYFQQGLAQEAMNSYRVAYLAARPYANKERATMRMLVEGMKLCRGRGAK